MFSIGVGVVKEGEKIKFLTFEVYKRRWREKNNKSEVLSKQIEGKLSIELQDKLSHYLSSNDKVMIEVNPNVLGEFLNVLSGRLLTMYDYEQIDKNKFIFYNKEFEF